MTSTAPGTEDVVLDEHALLALGAGNILVSRILHQSAATDDWRIHFALAALADADRAWPEHPPERPRSALSVRQPHQDR
jgi:hypothetical protein